MRNGIVKHSSKVDLAATETSIGKLFREKSNKPYEPGYYVMFGMWKGPFESETIAKECYREWAWEAKHS